MVAGAVSTTERAAIALTLRIRINPQMREWLERLLATGLFGTRLDDCAERLLSEAIRLHLHELRNGRQ